MLRPQTGVEGGHILFPVSGAVNIPGPRPAIHAAPSHPGYFPPTTRKAVRMEARETTRLSHGGALPDTGCSGRNATLQRPPPKRANALPAMRAAQAVALRQPPPGWGNVSANLGSIPPKNHGMRQHLAARPGFAERSRPLPPALEPRFTSPAGRPSLQSGSGPRPNPPHPPQPA